MDLNRFTANVQATTKQMKTSGRSNHIMLSVLSALDETFSEGQGIIGDLSTMQGALQSTQSEVEGTIVSRHNAREEMAEQEIKAEDLRVEQEREMEQQMDKVFQAEELLQETVADFNDARQHYDEADQDLSYWEGQAIQIVNTLNQQISSLESGAEALGLDINTEKYHNLVSKLEDNANHDRIDWTNE